MLWQKRFAFTARTAILGLVLCFVSLNALSAIPPKRVSHPTAKSDQDLSRYPYRVPDWLWKDQRRSRLIDEKLRKDLEADIQVWGALSTLKDTTPAEGKQAEIAQKVSTALSLRDLTSDAIVFANRKHGLTLAVQIDPSFDAKARKTILKGCELFLSCATDDDVARTAMADSIEDPTPHVPMYQVKDGMPLTDMYGNKLYTEQYKQYLSTRHRPANAASFKVLLRSVLSRPNGDPALLCVSRYTGGKWWGATYIEFYYDRVVRPARLSPRQGFLYIALNSDRMKPGVQGWDDGAFWASKIGHELLHSVGFDHPAYQDVADRDKNNPPGKRAFIVAYELAILKNLTKGK